MVSRTFRTLYSSASMSRDYNTAVAALNTLQSNFSIVDAIRKSGRGMNKLAIPEMIEWCRKIGYEPSDFDRLRPIHVAGTKGKGSTSAFVSSILSEYVPSAIPSVGLYTSPHLRSVRERIQIDNVPISEQTFASYFFDVWDRLENTASAEGQDPTSPSTKPVYFRYLTLMALHAYLREGVGAAVIECGIGGEYDSTNIITQPSVSAITKLGIDHVAMLGNTLPEIAWHKAGIFKPGTVALTVPQEEEAMKVLQERAAEKGVQLHTIQRHPQIDSLRLGLSADFQKSNASLAIAIAAAHLRALGDTTMPSSPSKINDWSLPPQFRRGLEKVRWPGRCETRREKNIAWHLDGAHTLDSIEVAGRWFAEEIASARNSSRASSTPSKPRILIFNQQTRDAASLARALHTALATGLSAERPFTHAVFTTNVTFRETGYKPDLVSVNDNASDVESLSVQESLAKTWAEVDPKTEVRVLRTIEDAVKYARDIAGAKAADDGEQVMVLVTGSLHLVGGALEVLESS